MQKQTQTKMGAETLIGKNEKCESIKCDKIATIKAHYKPLYGRIEASRTLCPECYESKDDAGVQPYQIGLERTEVLIL